MRVNLKALGLALVAAFAMSAVVAAAAQAENGQFTADEYPAIAKGFQETGEENYFEGTPEEKVKCGTADYQATLEEHSTEITVTPHYDECEKVPGNTAVNVTLNGCHYVFHTHGTTNESGETPGTADMVCPNKDDEITISGPLGICVDHIEQKSGMEGVTFTNKTPSTHDEETGTTKPYVTVDVHIEEIPYTHTDTPLCPWTATETREDGTLVTTVKMKGYEDEGGLIEGATGAETTYNAGSQIGIDIGIPTTE
jgi:hypothetical protein